jgi:hypothetical protein
VPVGAAGESETAVVCEGSHELLHVRLSDGRELAVPTDGFDDDWVFEPGDLVMLWPADAPASYTAEPYVLVTNRDGQRYVFTFNANGGKRLARVLPISPAS